MSSTLFLLDTCTFLWLVADPKKLSTVAGNVIKNVNNKIYLSSVSCWEISIKYSLGKLPLPESPSTYIPSIRDAHKIEALPLEEDQALFYTKIEQIHPDPFDRMLVAQAMHSGLTLITPNILIRDYPVRTCW